MTDVPFPKFTNGNKFSVSELTGGGLAGDNYQFGSNPKLDRLRRIYLRRFRQRNVRLPDFACRFRRPSDQLHRKTGCVSIIQVLVSAIVRERGGRRRGSPPAGAREEANKFARNSIVNGLSYSDLASAANARSRFRIGAIYE
jgi:hypothetical protein